MDSEVEEVIAFSCEYSDEPTRLQEIDLNLWLHRRHGGSQNIDADEGKELVESRGIDRSDRVGEKVIRMYFIHAWSY